jgi:soluble P-type ATPase
VPGDADLTLEHLVLDDNGTLTDRGQLIAGVEELAAQLRETLVLHVLSADTYRTAEDVAV